MSIRIPVALGTKRGLNAFVFAMVLLLGFATMLQAQCPLPDPDAPPKPPSPHAADEALLPENGHLSNASYTSDYVGLAFDLLKAFGFCIALLLGFATMLQAQCPLPDPDAPPKPPSPHAADEALLPENGHLSNATYT